MDNRLRCGKVLIVLISLVSKNICQNSMHELLLFNIFNHIKLLGNILLLVFNSSSNHHQKTRRIIVVKNGNAY